MIKKLGLLVLGFAVVLTLGACTDQVAESSASEIYVAVDINPSIEFIVDDEDVVTSFNLVNEDALILCADVEFIGMNIEDAVELFISLATEAGFIDIESEDNAVLFTVLGGDEDSLAEQLQERVRVRALRFFARNFINAEIFTEDFTQEDLVLQAEELGITPGKLKLILLAQSYDETLTIEVGMETPVKDLVAQVRAAQKEIMDNLTEEQRAALVEKKQALMTQYSERLETHLQENTPLTDEEIEAIVNRVQNTIRTTTREEWQEAAETWRNIIEERRQNTNNEDDDSTE
ncbi:MAG: hypothetical protein KQ78_00423 [Candidatus Izimaplasma bacterium HR2]|nr:MAG: hypothetical protein KQ78_00423 [Candidatus Izimaplasma bacterium HR2]